MAFFARPNLDNIQFKQLKDSVLTLSGQTQIGTTSGLTLSDGVGGNVIVTASGASNNFDVLTYCNGIISLQPPTASGGTGIYDCSSPTTCAVGGLPAGSAIYGSGITTILECILVPTLYPTLTDPSISSFEISPTSLLYEVGSCPTISGTVNFDAGCINPQYSSACDCRSNGTRCYTYLVKGLPYECVTNSPSNSYTFAPISISNGSNSLSATVYYCSGVQPKDSNGVDYCSPLSAGNTSASQINICGLYPWYWGIEASGGASAGINKPTTACIKSLITGGTATKVVANSDNSLFVKFNSTSDDYLWFAIPETSTSKTCWYETPLNNGSIGGSSNLFPNPTLVSGITSSSPAWSGQTYKIYISNYQTKSPTESDLNMELRN
jgi:hypothetical protein